MRKDGEDILTCEGLCLFGYFDVASEDGGADEDGFVDMEFGTVGAAFGSELDDEDRCSEIAGVGEWFVRWAVVVGRRGEKTYVNSPTREGTLYEARGAARDWGVLRMRLAGLASEDVLEGPRFLTAPVPWALGPDAGFSGCEEDAAGVGEAERDELGEADS